MLKPKANPPLNDVHLSQWPSPVRISLFTRSWSSFNPTFTGKFLDVGANHPIDWSNTYELEQHGWVGFLFENEPNAAAMLRKGRTSKVIEGDVTKQDWRAFVKANGSHFDFLSLDVDYISHGVLLEMLVAQMSFKIATIEHNEYNYPAGDSPRSGAPAL